MCCGKLLEMRLLKMLVLAHIFRHVHVVLLTRAGFDLGSCFFLDAQVGTRACGLGFVQLFVP